MWTLRKQPKAPEPYRPTEPVDYPDGVTVETELATYYIKGGKRYRFTSNRVLDSWGLRICPGTEASVKNLPLAKHVMGFRDGTLIMDFEDNTLYLISNLRRRKVTNPDWLDNLNLEVKDAIVASAKEVALHLEGEDLS